MLLRLDANVCENVASMQVKRIILARCQRVGNLSDSAITTHNVAMQHAR